MSWEKRFAVGAFSGGPQDLHTFMLVLCFKLVHGSLALWSDLLPCQQIITQQLNTFSLWCLKARVNHSDVWTVRQMFVGCGMPSKTRRVWSMVSSSGTTQTMNNEQSLNCFCTICCNGLVSSPYACILLLLNTRCCGNAAFRQMTKYSSLPCILMATAILTSVLWMLWAFREVFWVGMPQIGHYRN